VGKCGRYNVGKDYMCAKGPGYSWTELKNLLSGGWIAPASTTRFGCFSCEAIRPDIFPWNIQYSD